MHALSVYFSEMRIFGSHLWLYLNYTAPQFAPNPSKTCLSKEVRIVPKVSRSGGSINVETGSQRYFLYYFIIVFEFLMGSTGSIMELC